MSASLDVATGVLTVRGAGRGDVIVVTFDGGNAVGAFDPARIESVTVYGAAGADPIDVGAARAARDVRRKCLSE